jgi:hypothetical protein
MGMALLQKILRTDNEANISRALLSISFVSSNSAWFAGFIKPTANTTAAWKA